MMNLIRPLRTLALALLVTACLAAGSLPAKADDTEWARNLVTALAGEAVETFGGKPLTPEERGARLQSLIQKYTDLPMTSEGILGRYWQKATTGQQSDFATLVVQYAVASFSNQLSDLPPNQHMDITSTETDRSGHVLVHSLAVTPTDTTPVDWTIARAPDGRPVVTDVAVEGISLIQTMRGDFGSIIRANGGRIEPLLDALRQKIASYKSAKQ